jgi:hypothetical protein
MSITADILAAWKGPRRFIRAKLAERPREATVLVLMMAACVLAFIARWPALARQAELQRRLAEAGGMAPDQVPSLQALMGINLFVLVFVLPLLLFAVAALSHLVARAFGGRGDHAAARLALVWAFLAAAPAMLFQGLFAGLVGPGLQLTLVGALVALAFLWLWLSMLVEAER